MLLIVQLCVVLCSITNDVVGKKKRPVVRPIVLSNGVKMPRIGFTTWTGFSSQHSRPSDMEPSAPDLAGALHWALDRGYRYIDAAAWEGTNEAVLGSVLVSKFADNYITRRHLFISTKLSSYSHGMRGRRVVPELQESLERLRLQYVDLYLMHLPIALLPGDRVDDSSDYLETWSGVLDALRLNLTRAVGIAHLHLELLEPLRARGTPHVLMIEVNLNLQQPELLAWCAEQRVAVVAVAPLGSLYSRSAGLQGAPLPRLDDPVLAGLANKYARTVPQVALRWLVQRGAVPLISSHSHYQLTESLNVFNFELDDYEMFLLKSFNNGFRTVDFKYWSHARLYPFRGDELVEYRQNMYPEYYKLKFSLPMYAGTKRTITSPVSDI